MRRNEAVSETAKTHRYRREKHQRQRRWNRRIQSRPADSKRCPIRLTDA